MAGKRKNYTIRSEGGTVVDIDGYREAPWRQRWGHITFDFRRWCYIGRPALDAQGQGEGVVHANRDGLVEVLRDAVWHMKGLDITKQTYCNGGLKYFFEFLDDLHTAGQPVTILAQIDKKLLERYIFWLRHIKVADTESGRLGYASAKDIYTKTKSPLRHLVNHKALPEDIFPANPFPNSNRAQKSHPYYTKKVMGQLLFALGQDIKGLRDGTLRLSPGKTLTVYLLVIAARSGRNPEPLLSATRDALQPHPVKPAEMGLLVVYKNRGNNTHVQAYHTQAEVEEMVLLPLDAVTLFHEVNRMTAPLAADAPGGARDRLWLYRPTKGSSLGQVVTLSKQAYLHCAKSIVKRHGLKDADDQPLRLNISRLRATFNQRMWNLTGGDILKTAKLTGNTPQVNDRHYLAVTPEMEGNHRRLGHIMHADLSGALENPEALEAVSQEVGIPVGQLIHIANGDNNTGVGRCRDPQHGANAPGDGSACTQWLSCFTCPDQVVLESDLYRLYSFYFLLLKERNFMQRRRWEATYGRIIKIIDNEIVGPNLRTNDNPRGCFAPLRVKRMRERAECDPHPMWRDRAILAVGGGNDIAA